jgi:hypothetical protein
MSMKDEFGPTQEQWKRIVRHLMEMPEVDRACISFDEVDETAPVFVRYDEHGVDFSLTPHAEEDAADCAAEAAAKQMKPLAN